MKQYKVISGDMNEIVEAESHVEAAAKLFTMFDDDDDPPSPGAYISTIEVVGDEVWHETIAAIKRSGRWVGTDVNTADESSSENPKSSGSKATATEATDTST